jgi:hypothetical protein
VREGGPPAAQEPTRATQPGPTVVQGRPAWVDHPPQQSGMLFGVAGAPRGPQARTAAQEKAYREVAAQIALSLTATTVMVERETASTYGGKRVQSAALSYQQTIETQVAQERLPGLTVQEVAETADTTWVLVAFDRAAWAAQLRTRLAEIDRAMAEVRETVKRESAAGRGGVGALARAAQRLLPLAAEHAALARRLASADPTAPAPQPAVNLDRFRSDLAQAIDGVSVALMPAGGAGGDQDALLAGRLAGSLSRAGLRVLTADAAGAQFRLGLTARTQELPIDAERRRVNLTLAVAFTGTDGRVLGTIEVKGSGLSTPQIARDKAADDAAQKLTEAMDQQLLDLLARL